MKRWSYLALALTLALGIGPISVLAQAGRGGRGQRPPPPEVIRPADQVPLSASRPRERATVGEGDLR